MGRGIESMAKAGGREDWMINNIGYGASTFEVNVRISITYTVSRS